MDDNNYIRLAYDYAANYEFITLLKLLSEDKFHLDSNHSTDIYLILAQIQLFSSDINIMKNLNKADKQKSMPQYPCLRQAWQFKSPNRFIVFQTEEGALSRFLNYLPETANQLTHWYGESGCGMARQLESEIRYFRGEYGKAILLAQDQLTYSVESRADELMAYYVLFRCWLGLGETKKAQNAMFMMIERSSSQYSTEYSYEIYQSIRDWANLTTGWSGDTPRYHSTPDGYVLPVLEDRVAAILKGISQLSDSEKPFADFASISYKNYYAVRWLYMDIFYAINSFRAGQYNQAMENFQRAYQLACASDIIMPFVEYGNQILPLLCKILKIETRYSSAWINRVITLAEQYEDSINAYRGLCI